MNWYKKAQSDFYTILMELKLQMATVAQQVYNEWEQDENGIDPMFGSGGICQDIAQAIGEVIHANTSYETATLESQCGEQHVWILTYKEDPIEGYQIDIEPSRYETGGGYTWQKRPGIVLDANDIDIFPADEEVIQSFINEEIY